MNAELALEHAPPPPRTSLGRTLSEIITDVRVHRELMYEFARRDIRIRYKQAVMGFGWAIFMPILIVLSGVLIRVAMGEASGADVGRLDIAAIALKGVAWAFFAGAVNTSPRASNTARTRRWASRGASA